MLKFITQEKEKGLYIYHAGGKFPDDLHNLELMVAYGDPDKINWDNKEKFNVLTYQLTEKEEKELYLVNKKYLPTEDDIITLRFIVNSDVKDTQILKISNSADRVIELGNTVGLHVDENSEIYEIKYDNNLDDGKIKVALTATTLFRVMLLHIHKGDISKAYEFLKKLKNTLSLWK